ncbi:Pao retrotransposon peptidase family protein [Dirofilaria immitis]|nr:Pao retrotransposon peptidase family protein [Dirofilaria immitis]
MGIQDRPNEDDEEQALQQFKRSITEQNGRYQVSWPWKESKDKLKSHHGLCFDRLKTLIKRLQDNKEILQRYTETIKDQLQSGVIEQAYPDMDREGILHCLPHHKVVSSHKPIIKLRTVHDASVYFRGTKSSNEVLYRGPIIFPDLVGISLGFRMMRNVIVADDLECYRFRRVQFGVISSPFLLSATLNHHLVNIGSQTALKIEGTYTSTMLYCPRKNKRCTGKNITNKGLLNGTLVPDSIQTISSKLVEENNSWYQTLDEDDKETWKSLQQNDKQMLSNCQD